MSDSDAADILDATVSPKLEDREDSAVAETAHKVLDLSKVRAIYFDLDDTLCGYWDASKRGLIQAFEAHLPEGRTSSELMEAWATAFRDFAPTLKTTDWYAGYLLRGEPTRTEQMRRMLEVLGIADAELAAQLSETYMRQRDQNLTLFPDAVEVLDALKVRYPLGLITNGPADIQRQEIATLGIEPYFDHVFIEGEVGEGKPSPMVFRRAEEAVGFSGDQVLMVGNSFGHDVVPALKAGWRAIWIRRPSDVPPSATEPESMPPGAPAPDAIIGDLKTLLRLLPA